MAPTPDVTSLDTRLALLSDAVLAHVPAAAQRRAGSGSADVLGDPQAADSVDWDSISQALREVHVSAQHDFAAASAQLEALDAQTQQQLRLLNTDDSRAVDENVSQIHTDVSALLGELGASERHFRDVAALVAPAQRNLEALEARAAYYRAALDVERLSQHARTEAVQATRSALDAFQALSRYVSELPPEFTHVRATAEKRLAALTRDLKTFAIEKLKTALEAIAWPAALAVDELDHKSAELQAVAQAFTYLLALQLSQEIASPIDTRYELWAIDTLVHAIAMRFRYHFERADSPTNRLAKPEWFLSHVVAQVQAHASFLDTVIAPALVAERAVLPCCDAQVLLLRGLVVAAQHKLRADIPLLVSHPALLCHTIDEVLLFEQTLDDAFAYASYANSHRARFSRCVDVFTDNMTVFVAWTRADVAYATRMLADDIFSDSATAWTIDLDEVDDTLSSDERRVPRGTLHAVSLLDFLCRRFANMASDEHRFLYLTHVHFVVLRDLLRACERCARTINVYGASEIVAAVRDVCAVVNAAQYVAAVLAAWEQTPAFLALTANVVQSDTMRTHVRRIHNAYSTSVRQLQSAAHAASSAVLAREEAVAVRQAIAGPGSLIGPTAALSAAYSVGSKTVRSLLGRADTTSVDASSSSSPVKLDGPINSSTATDGRDTAAAQTAAADALTADDELVFSRSIFEHQIADFRALALRLLHSIGDAAVTHCRHDIQLYAQSLFDATAPSSTSSADATVSVRDVSPALGASLLRLDRVFAVAAALLSRDSCAHLATSVATALDELLLNAIGRNADLLTLQARAQCAFDIDVLGRVLERLTPRAKKHLRHTIAAIASPAPSDA